MHRNQCGFTVIEGFIIAVVVLALAFGGWYVWQSQDKTEQYNTNTQPNSGSTGNNPKEEVNEDPAYTYPSDTWYEYTNEHLGFAFNYPKDWSEIDVSFDREDFFLADFNNPTDA